jgi:hypothetical protein
LKPFDNRHCDLKLKPANKRLHENAGKCWNRANNEAKELGNQARLYPAFIECHISALRSYLEDIDSACRLVWLSDGNAITAEFIRSVVTQHIFGAIGARMGSIRGELQRYARITGEHNTAGQHHLVQMMNQLQEEFSARYEVEAIELEKSAHWKSAATSVFAVPSAHNSDVTGEVGMLETTKQDGLVGRGIAASKFTESTVNSWRAFHDRYMQLAREEQGRAELTTRGKCLRVMEQLLRASCSYSEHPEGWERGKPGQGPISLLQSQPYGVWNYDSDGISENFRERVRLCVADAGHTLADYPAGTNAEDFWLHRLYHDLLENNSDQLFAASDEGGMILSVCVASATFCSRLEKKALETLTSFPERDAERRNARGPAGFDQSENLRKAISKKNARIEQLERILSQPEANLASLSARNLIEEKQHLAMAVEELRQELSLSEARMTKVVETAVPAPSQRLTLHKRLAGTVSSVAAARRMESYLESKGIGQTEFAVQVGTTDRTLRTFRKTGRVRRDIFEAIAKAMGTTKEALLNLESKSR